MPNIIYNNFETYLESTKFNISYLCFLIFDHRLQFGDGKQTKGTFWITFGFHENFDVFVIGYRTRFYQRADLRWVDFLGEKSDKCWFVNFYEFNTRAIDRIRKFGACFVDNSFDFLLEKKIRCSITLINIDVFFIIWVHLKIL